ncbi:MAG: helix-turn-helix domain-containing protein [Marinicellaceae bacterium]
MSRKTNQKADRFLAAVLFIVALWNASILILLLEIYQYAAGIIWIPLTYTLALGPCFYFYICYITSSNTIKKQKVWPHFIPVMFEISLFLIEVFQGLPLGLAYFETPLFLTIDPIISALAIVSLLIYSVMARVRIQKYHQWVKNNFSHDHRYNLNWLMRLSTIFLIVLTLWLGYFFIDYFLFDYRLGFTEYYPFHLSLAIISIWLSIEAFSKPEIIFPENIKAKKTTEKINGIQDTELKDKAQWIKKQIETHLFYLDPELSLKSLAENVNLHPNIVSRIINEGLMKSFSDCINEYRVNAVIKKLEYKQSSNASFLAIAFDCGFNSKTTFNRVFKKQIGMTPLQYQNKIKKSQ